MRLVYEPSDRIAEWLGERLGEKFSTPYTVIGGLQNDALACAWLFNHYNGRNIEVSVASDGSVDRGFIMAAADYVFNQLKCERASCHVSENNHKSIAFIERIGWKREGFRENWYEDGSGAFLYGMKKEDCKWLKPLGM